MELTKIEILGSLVMLVLGLVWLIQAIYGFFQKRKSERLNEMEQRAETAKHEAERKLFEAKLKEMKDET